jgi:hypothetical protein
VRPRRLESPSVACDSPRTRWSLPVVQGPVEDTIHDATALLTGPLDDSARDKDEVEWQSGRVYLHLGARRDDRPRD